MKLVTKKKVWRNWVAVFLGHRKEEEKNSEARKGEKRGCRRAENLNFFFLLSHGITRRLGFFSLFLGDITVCAQDVAEGIGFQFQQKKRMCKEGPRHSFYSERTCGETVCTFTLL